MPPWPRTSASSTTRAGRAGERDHGGCGVLPGPPRRRPDPGRGTDGPGPRRLPADRRRPRPRPGASLRGSGPRRRPRHLPPASPARPRPRGPRRLSDPRAGRVRPAAVRPAGVLQGAPPRHSWRILAGRFRVRSRRSRGRHAPAHRTPLNARLGACSSCSTPAAPRLCRCRRCGRGLSPPPLRTLRAAARRGARLAGRPRRAALAVDGGVQHSPVDTDPVVAHARDRRDRS